MSDSGRDKNLSYNPQTLETMSAFVYGVSITSEFTVHDDGDFLAMLGCEDIVEESGLARSQIS